MAESSPISVLVADDSSLMRTVVTDILNADPAIQVVGTATNGKEAVKLANKLKPDVVIVDLDMPTMNGVEATDAIMRNGEKPIIVVFSSYTKNNADLALACMHMGAFACVEKPTVVNNDIAVVSEQLTAQIKAAARVRTGVLKQTYHKTRTQRAAGTKRSSPALPLVIIGASTGGPPVLEQILIQLETCPQAAIVIVQHMPAHFTKSMAARLDAHCTCKVKEAEEGERLKAGVILVAPGDYHLQFQRNQHKDVIVHLTQDDPVHGLRPAIDVTMESAASVYGHNVTGIILTGMGQDGTNGMQHIKIAGGHTIAQTPQTCVIDGMVQNAMGCDCVDNVLPPETIAECIQHLPAATA